jgi:acyl carrier protein
MYQTAGPRARSRMTIALDPATSPDSPYLQPLLAFVQAELTIDEDDDIDPDTPLLDLGLVDSLAVVALLGFVEEAFGLHVPEGLAHVRHLRSVRAMAEWLEGLRPATAA